MLTVRFENLTDVAAIYDKLALNETPKGANFVMYDEGTPVAVWRMILERDGGSAIGIIDKIFFADGVEEGDKTFFLHAMFYKLLESAPMRLRIEGERREFEKFGFQLVDGNMEINSQEINLYYRCGGKIN